MMHESQEDLSSLQRLLDASYERAGAHLREVITEERRVTAIELANRLDGMRLLVLTTVNRSGQPVGAPVDGLFNRSAFYFGTSPDSVRAKHLRRSPFATATHLPGEEFAVTVHGRAVLLDLHALDQAG